MDKASQSSCPATRLISSREVRPRQGWPFFATQLLNSVKASCALLPITQPTTTASVNQAQLRHAPYYSTTVTEVHSKYAQKQAISTHLLMRCVSRTTARIGNVVIYKTAANDRLPIDAAFLILEEHSGKKPLPPPPFWAYIL